MSESTLPSPRHVAVPPKVDDVFAPVKRKRGRPAGKKMQVAAAQLRLHHFSYLRWAIELPGTSLKKAWENYLAFEGGSSDERHCLARLRELVALVRLAANGRGLAEEAECALTGIVPVASPPSPALPAGDDAKPATTAPVSAAPAAAAPVSVLPTLDEWIAERCEQTGVDVDFYSQAEWLGEYQSEFGLDQSPAPVPATALPEAPSSAPIKAGEKSRSRAAPSPALPSLQSRLEALHHLAKFLARPPALNESLNSWLSADLARRLAETKVDGRLQPVLTVAQLIDFVNLHHHRWWKHVPRLGRERGDRITAWLTPLAEALGRPLKEVARRPLHEIRLVMQRSVTQKRYGMVRLDDLWVPRELDGHDGDFRAQGKNTLGAETDLEAIMSWMRDFANSPRTSNSYGPIVERFYLWSILVKGKPMSSLTKGDLLDYRDFITRPPADWVQPRQVVRGSADWRPFRGPLSELVRKRNFIVIAQMLGALHEAGYLSANAARGVLKTMKVPGKSINTSRSFTEAQWSFVMQRWTELYAVCGPAFGEGEEQPFCPDADHPDRSFARAAQLRRTRLLLELGSTTGLRLSEFATTRFGKIQRSLIDGEEVWMMEVLGKGKKLGTVMIFDDVMMMLEQHHRDMDVAKTAFDKNNKNPLRELYPSDALSSTLEGTSGDGASGTQLLSAGVAPEDRKPDWANRPLVGALRRSAGRWKLDGRGVKVKDTEAPKNFDPYGAIDPSALYQSLKRFLQDCGRESEKRGLSEKDAKTFEAASTHWMRHFFANTALADGLAVEVVMKAMRHSSLTTTSIYLNTEEKRMVEELGKLRRRGAAAG